MRTISMRLLAGLGIAITLSCAPADRNDPPPPTSDDAGVKPRDAGPRDAGPLGKVGDPCREDAECAEVPGKPVCLSSAMADRLGFAAPAGYCTSITCDSSAVTESCGENTVCGALLGAGSVCERGCRVNSDCRSGYHCESGGCHPAFRGLPDAGMPPDGGEVPSCGLIDAPCCTGSSCWPGGSCLSGNVCQRCEFTACSGACVNTASDYYNCGRCGHVCPANNSCLEGECVVSQCVGGQSLCSASGGNYCANLATDVNNCGSCGHKCSGITASFSCQNGTCHIEHCADGQLDCDNNPDNGCEAFNTCPDPCGVSNDCLSCVRSGSCGWCSATANCQSGGSLGSSTCSGTNWVWTSLHCN